MASWIKCTNTKHEAVYINLDNAVTVTRNDVADRIAERGTVISFMRLSLTFSVGYDFGLIISSGCSFTTM